MQTNQARWNTLRTLTGILALALTTTVATQVASADVYTQPVGFWNVTAPTNTDTYLSIPFTQIPAAQGLIASASGSAISVSNSPGWTPGQFAVATKMSDGNTYFSHFAFIGNTNATKAGAYYVITNNDASTLYVQIDAENLTGVNAGDQVQVIPFWTLNTVWPSGAGVVPSTSSLSGGRRTQILFPDLTTSGINLAPNQTFFYFNNAWRKAGTPAASNYNAVAILPDQYVVQRQATNLTDTSTITTLGQVVMGPVRIALYQSGVPNLQQDNFVALYRPAVQTLNQSSLTNAFVASTSSLSSGRKDQLLALDYNVGINKAPGASTYYYFNNGWRKVGVLATIDFGTSNNIITPTTGFVLRKTTNTVNTIWVNQPNYSN